MPQGMYMRTMRIASAINASVELSEAKKCVDENGYCWWGTGKNASIAHEIIVRTQGDSKKFHGIMEVSDLVNAENISQSDFISNKPKNSANFPSEKRQTQYYKITSITIEKIPREKVLYAETERKLTANQLHANTRVILDS